MSITIKNNNTSTEYTLAEITDLPTTAADVQATPSYNGVGNTVVSIANSGAATDISVQNLFTGANTQLHISDELLMLTASRDLVSKIISITPTSLTGITAADVGAVPSPLIVTLAPTEISESPAGIGTTPTNPFIFNGSSSIRKIIIDNRIHEEINSFFIQLDPTTVEGSYEIETLSGDEYVYVRTDLLADGHGYDLSNLTPWTRGYALNGYNQRRGQFTLSSGGTFKIENAWWGGDSRKLFGGGDTGDGHLESWTLTVDEYARLGYNDTWWTGSEVPASHDFGTDIPLNNDFYLQSNGDVYQFQTATWTLICNTISTSEPSLGNPDVDGKVLASTTAGVRSWITATSNLTYETDFLQAGANSNAPWLGEALVGGTCTTQVGLPNHPGIIRLANSATAGSSYWFRTDLLQLSGGEEMEFVFRIPVANTAGYMRAGFFNSLTVGGLTSQVALIYDMSHSTTAIRFLASKVGVTLTSADYAFTIGTWYRATMKIADDLQSVTCKIFGADGTQLFSEVIDNSSSNMPNVTSMYHGVFAGASSGAANTTQFDFDYMRLSFTKKLIR
jgi:hypothetical protein